MRGRTTTGAAMLVAALTLASCGEDEERGDPAAEAGADGGGEGAEGGEPQCPEGTRWADGECHPSQGPGGDEGGEAGGGEGAGGQGGEGAEAGGAQGDDGGDGTCETDAEFFEARLWAPVFEGRCLACHVAGGAAAATRMVLEPADADGWLERNLAAVQAVAMVEAEGRPLLLQKPTGRLPHGGGVQIAVDAAEYPDLEALVARLRDEVDPCGRPLDGGGDPPPPDGGQDCDALRPGRRLLRRLSHTEYDNTVRDLTGVQVDAHATFVADPLIHGFENHPEALEVSGLLAVQQNQVAESVGERIDVTDHLPCALAEGDMACAHAFIARFGGRAFRRPLTAAEIAAYRELFALVMAQECFEQGARWVVTAMLQSPHFLYRAELGRSDGEDFALTPHEIASEMSYLLWQSMPDEPLRARADDGGLLDPAVRAEQLARMLDDPRTLSTLHDFVGRWLGADAVLSVVRDSEIYEALYFELRESLLLETRLFASDLWVRGRPWGDLFTADHTFLDGPLAEYYGLDLVGDPGPEGFHKVPLGGARAGGVLAHGSVMTAHESGAGSPPAA